MMTIRFGGCPVFGCLSEASRPAMPPLILAPRPATPTTPPPVARFRPRAASRGPAYLVASACQSVAFLKVAQTSRLRFLPGALARHDSALSGETSLLATWRTGAP